MFFRAARQSIKSWCSISAGTKTSAREIGGPVLTAASQRSFYSPMADLKNSAATCGTIALPRARNLATRADTP